MKPLHRLSLTIVFLLSIVTGSVQGASVDTTNLGVLLGQPGECRLVKSGDNLVLLPYNGNRIGINGVLYTIPSSGISLSPSAFTIGQVYYIYIYNSSGTLTLEGSQTSHAADTTTGYEIKSGDATRSLVGMAGVIDSGGNTRAWVDSSSQRFVLSWFNQRMKVARGDQGGSTSSSSYVEINSSNRAEFLVWANTTAKWLAAGYMYNNTTAADVDVSLGLNNASIASSTSQGRWKTSSANYPETFAVNGYSDSLSELTFYYVTLIGDTNTGTATYAGTSVTVEISG